MKISGMNKIQPASSLDTTTAKNNKKDKDIKQIISKKNISTKSLLKIINKTISARSVKTTTEKKLRLKLKTCTTTNSLADNSNLIQTEHSPISFDPKTRIDSKTITSELLMHWTGKDADYLEENKKAITNLNSSAMLAFATLVKEGARLTTTPLPNCLISSTPTNSKFEASVQKLLKDVIKLNPKLESTIKNSPGLFKTPILISHKIKSKVQIQENIEEIRIQEKQITSGIKYYSQIDTKNTASNSVTTLYLPDIKNKNRHKLIQGLDKALNKAVDRAEDLIPIESKKTAKNFLMS